MPTEEQAGEILVSDAVKLSGLSNAYIRRLIQENRVKGRRLGPIWLVDRASLLAYTNTYHKPGPKGPRHQKQTGAHDKSTPVSHLTEQPSPKGRKGVSADSVAHTVQPEAQADMRAVDMHLDTGAHIRIDALQPIKDQWLHAEATQGDVEAHIDIRPYGNPRWPGGYVLDYYCDRADSTKKGKMGRNQEERAQALMHLLSEHVTEAMQAAGWQTLTKTPTGATLWHYRPGQQKV